MKRLNQLTQSINSFIPTRKDPWWGLPLALFGLAVCCAMASLLVYPEGTQEELWLLGLRFGGECGMKIQFGIPCPQCGMTRSWVEAVRGNFGDAFFYNPAGFLLFWWIMIGGLIGLLRLVFRKPKLLAPPWPLFLTWSIFWLVVPYMAFFFARLGGVNALPEYHPDFDVPAQSAPHK